MLGTLLCQLRSQTASHLGLHKVQHHGPGMHLPSRPATRQERQQRQEIQDDGERWNGAEMGKQGWKGRRKNCCQKSKQELRKNHRDHHSSHQTRLCSFQDQFTVNPASSMTHTVTHFPSTQLRPLTLPNPQTRSTSMHVQQSGFIVQWSARTWFFFSSPISIYN
jgi:hypothetical protein